MTRTHTLGFGGRSFGCSVVSHESRPDLSASSELNQFYIFTPFPDSRAPLARPEILNKSLGILKDIKS